MTPAATDLSTEVRDRLELFDAHRRLDDLADLLDAVRALLDYIEG
jgi:hypothetical protein